MSQHLRLVTADTTPAPSADPRDLVHDALETLLYHQLRHPTVWEYSGELRAVESLLFKCLYALGRAP